MPPADSFQHRPDPKRRRTVRIVGSRSATRSALVSLSLAIVVALLVFSVWRVLREDDTRPTAPRTLEQLTLEWKCDQGHVFDAAGQVGPRECWICDHEAYPISRQYACPVHGAHEVAVRFTIGDHGVPRPLELRLPELGWMPVEEGVPCPRCARPLVYMGRDLLSRAKGRPDRPGG